MSTPNPNPATRKPTKSGLQRHAPGEVQLKVIETVIDFFKPGEHFTDSDVRYLLPDVDGKSLNRVLHDWHRRAFRYPAVRSAIRGNRLETSGRSSARDWWIRDNKAPVEPAEDERAKLVEAHRPIGTVDTAPATVTDSKTRETITGLAVIGGEYAFYNPTANERFVTTEICVVQDGKIKLVKINDTYYRLTELEL